MKSEISFIIEVLVVWMLLGIATVGIYNAAKYVTQERSRKHVDTTDQPEGQVPGHD
jgi:hypothetical protein